MSIKSKSDFQLIRKAAEVTCDYFSEFVEAIEYHIEDNDVVKHNDISDEMEKKLEKSKYTLKSKYSIHEQFYDFSYTPVVQSGGDYDLRPTSESNFKNLSGDVILLNMAGKYFEMNCNICRTLLINPSDKIQQDYKNLVYLHVLLQ